MFPRALQKSQSVLRQFVRNSSDHHDHGGVPFGNMPFTSRNRYKFSLIFTIFCGTGLAVPFLMVRHQILKNKA